MEKVRLCDVCDFQGGTQPPKDEWSFEKKDGYIRMLQIRDFTQTRNVEKEYIKLTSSTKKCEADDILIARYGASVGKILTGLSGAYNVAIMKTIPNERLLNKSYLKYYLLSDYFQNRINSVGERAAQAGFNKEDLSKFLISLVSLQEQKRIADELDKVFNLIDKRKEQLLKLDELVKARFVELFGNGNYPMVKAEDVCDFITKGTTPPTGEIYSDYSKDKVPYLKVYNLSFTGELLFDNEPQFISKDIHNGKLSRSKVYPNDVLMNIVGPPLGKFSLVTNEYEEWNINQAIAIFRAKERIEPKFLLVALMQPSVLQPFLNQAVGIRQLNLSLEQCRNLEFPLPPIDEQKQFAAFVKQTDKSKLEVQKSLEKLELLKKALMQKYFG